MSSFPEQVFQKQAMVINTITNLSAPYSKAVAGLDLTVFPKVYHSGTDTTLLCEKVKVTSGQTALDLCTGNGAVALRMKLLGASSVTAVDINPEAVKNASYNSQNLGLPIEVLEGNLFQPVLDRRFDVITINPPFSNHKPSNTIEMMFWDENYHPKAW